MTDTKDTEAQRRARLIYCAVPLAIFTVSSTVGAMFMPYLLAEKPLLLVALSPLFRHLVLAAPSLPAASLFAVAVPRHFIVDPFVYLLGRDYGPVAIEWVEANSPGLGKLVRTLERLFGKVGAVALLVSPDVIVSTLAGAARVPFPLFVVMNLLGTVATVTVARWFGNALEAQIHALVAFFQAHLVAVTVASVLLVVALNVWPRRKTPAGEASGE